MSKKSTFSMILSQKLNSILTADSKTFFIWPWCLLGGYSAQAIKECIDYELKSADNLYVLMNFCKLLSLTYYTSDSDYFTLENTDSGKVLTAVYGSLQIKGMF